MQEFLEKLRENPRIVVVALITAGVIALALGNNGDDNNAANTDVNGSDTTSQIAEETLEETTAEGTKEDSTYTNTNNVVIGSEPPEGPVEIEKSESKYTATVRSGDNQTVVARQMVNDFLDGQSQSLSAEQRLYVETVIVDTLPRNDVIHVGDVITVEETVISGAVADSGELTEGQIAAWAAYL